MKVIGLTGGIGVGKSSVVSLLQSLGAHIIEADQVGHRVYRPGTEGWQRVVVLFGPDILDANEEVDRKRLGELVFSDPDAIASLNAAVHPLISEEIQARLKALEGDGAAVAVVEAAVLLEAEWDAMVDEVWVVSAPEERTIERVQLQRGLTEPQVRQRMKAQSPAERKLQRADVVIDNGADTEALRRRVESLWRERLSGASE